MSYSYKAYEYHVEGHPDQDILVSPPFYFARDADGNPTPTHPENVGSAPVRWTAYIFITTDQRETMRQTMVMMTGELGYPPTPVVNEARMQLFGAQTK